MPIAIVLLHYVLFDWLINGFAEYIGVYSHWDPPPGASYKLTSAGILLRSNYKKAKGEKFCLLFRNVKNVNNGSNVTEVKKSCQKIWQHIDNLSGVR